MITESEQLTLDLDWFFTDNEHVIFAASGGGKLPESVAKSWSKYKLLLSFFSGLPKISLVVIDPDLNKMISSPADEKYLSTFIEMAEKGLFAFDKTMLNNAEDPHYHLVAKSINALKIINLPYEIRTSILKSKYHGNIESILDVRLVR